MCCFRCGVVTFSCTRTGDASSSASSVDESVTLLTDAARSLASSSVDPSKKSKRDPVNG